MAHPPNPAETGLGPCPTPAPLCHEARDIVDQALVKERTAVIELLERCESPVEQMLIAALWEHWRCRVEESRLGMSAVLEGASQASPMQRVFVEPQKVIATERARYRADALVSVASWESGARRIAPGPLIVEVDGHEFHERTKYQAARDRQRDRAMIAEGFRVVRFTGQEVWQEPERCAQEVARILA